MLFFPLRFWRIRSNLKYGDFHTFPRKPSGKQAELDTKMKNTKIYLLLFLFLAIIAPFSWAYPDLEVYEILFSTNYPNENDVFTASATVHNDGDDYSDPVFRENAEPVSNFTKIYNDMWHAQSFTYSEKVNLIGVSLCIKDIGVKDSLTVTIETDEIVSSTHVPSGNLVVETASTTVNGRGDGYYWENFTFSGLVPLLTDTTYWIVAQNSAGLIDDGYSVILTSYNNYGNGREVYSSNLGDTWTEWQKRDLLFKAYHSTTTIVKFYDGDPALNKLIGTDTISPVPKNGDVIASISISTTAGYHDIYAYVNPDNRIFEQNTANNKNNKIIAVDCPRIIKAETVDDDLNGCIDAYHIVFNEDIDDSTLIQTSICGFVVAGYSDLKVLTTLANHLDVLDDNDIYLCFTEVSTDTAVVPEVRYSSSTGGLTDLDNGVLLLDVSTSTVVEQDGAAPIIYSAEAPDYSGENPGIESGDRIEIKFSESVSGPPNINSTNIDEVLITTGSFKDGDEFIGSAVWSEADSKLTISLSVSGGAPNIFPGYTITTDTFTFKDSFGNVSSHTIVLGGDLDITSPTIVSTSPEDEEKGISVDASIQINFSERMNATNTEGAISVKEIRDKDGKDIDPPKAISGDASYNPDTFCLTFTPGSNLKNNFTYKVIISENATDTIGHNLALSEFSFTTISNYKESNTFVSGDGEMKIILDARTLKEDFSVQISTSPLIDSPRKTNIIDANNKLDNDDDPFSFALESTIVEIKAFYADGNPIIGTFEIPATITLSYEDSNPEDRFVEKTLKVYWLNESHSLWVKLSDSEVDTGSNRVSADTFHFSIFSLHGVGTTDLSDAYAFPVPFIPSRGDTDITFTEISPLCTIKIYTLNGELVRTIEHTSGETSHSWDDVTNDRGDRLASGVYLYIIKNDKGKKKGKLIIIR